MRISSCETHCFVNCHEETYSGGKGGSTLQCEINCEGKISAEFKHPQIRSATGRYLEL